MGSKARYPGTIEQRGNGFRVSLRVAGERHRFTLANVSKKEAEAFARRKGEELEELARRQTLGLPDLIPFAGVGAAKCRENTPRGGEPVPVGFLDRYELERLPRLAAGTQRSYATSLAHVRQFFNREYPGLRIDEVRPAHVREYLNWRGGRVRGKAAEASARTVAKDRATLRAAFSYALELELRDTNPVAAVRPPKVVKRDPVLITPEEYERLLDACGENDMLRLYLLFLGETGTRADSEALRLKWENIDLDGGFVWIPSTREHRTKSGAGRWVPLTQRLREALREHFRRYRFASYGGRRPEYIFHHTYTRRKAVAGERVRDFRAGYERAIRDARLPAGFHRHDLRHRRVTTWLAEGADVVKVKEAVGHASLATTMGYTHLAREHLRDLVEPVPPRPGRSAGGAQG